MSGCAGQESHAALLGSASKHHYQRKQIREWTAMSNLTGTARDSFSRRATALVPGTGSCCRAHASANFNRQPWASISATKLARSLQSREGGAEGSNSNRLLTHRLCLAGKTGRSGSPVVLHAEAQCEFLPSRQLRIQQLRQKFLHTRCRSSRSRR